MTKDQLISSLSSLLPLCRIKFDPPPTKLLRVLLKLFQPGRFISRIPKAVRNHSVRMLLSERLISFQVGKAVVIKVSQVLRIENRKINITIFEYILLEIFIGILLIFLVRPDVFLWAELMIIVEAFDKLFAVSIFDVFVAAIP